MSLVTNKSILDNDSTQTPPCHAEVMETADRRAKDMQLLVKTVIGRYTPPSLPTQDSTGTSA